MQGGESISANRIVLALPPRVAAGLEFDPYLTQRQINAMQEIPTWMAGHAKFFAVYEDPFWRRAGLSGDAFSRHGPLAEIHDASAQAGTPAALFGFLGVSASVRESNRDAIIDAALEQLVRIFGAPARNPVKTYLQDWAQDPFTATVQDQTPPMHHPDYGMPSALASIWDGKLQMCSTEVAPEMGGFLEGALAVAEKTAEVLLGEDTA